MKSIRSAELVFTSIAGAIEISTHHREEEIPAPTAATLPLDSFLTADSPSLPIAPKLLTLSTSYRTPPTTTRSLRYKSGRKTRSSTLPTPLPISIIPGASLAKRMGVASIYVPSTGTRTTMRESKRLLAMKKSERVGEDMGEENCLDRTKSLKVNEQVSFLSCFFLCVFLLIESGY